MRILKVDDCDDSVYIINKGFNYILYEPPNDFDWDYGCSINGCLDLDREAAFNLYLELKQVFEEN